MTTLNLAIKLSTDGAGKVRAELQGVEGAVDRTGRAAKRASPAVSGLGKTLSGLVTGAMVAATIIAVNEYERLGAVMKTLTGDASLARAEMDRLREFATQTPFELQGVIEAFARLQSVGLDPSTEALRSYGNTAAAMGRDLMQFVEAVADATTGEFERLKDFGIKASVEQDKVRFTFRGTTTEIGKNAAEIEKYLRSIGDNEFATGMSEQMDTLGGVFSNLKDEVFQLSAALGDAGISDVLKDLTRFLIDMSKAIRQEVIPAFGFMLERIGLFRNEVARLTEDEIGARLILLDEQIADLEKRIANRSKLNPRGSSGKVFDNDVEELQDLRLRYAELEQELNERRNAGGLPEPGTAADNAGSSAKKAKDAYTKWREELVLDAAATELLHKQVAELDKLLFEGDISEGRHAEELEKLTGKAEEYRQEIERIPDEWDIALDLIDAEFRKLDEAEARAIAGLKDMKDEGKDTFEELKDAINGWGKEFTNTLADMVVEGKADFSDLADSIIRDLVRIQIQKRVTDKLVKAGTSTLDSILSGFFHGGGIAGEGSSFVSVPALAFAGAPRYHAGGIAGEVPAILKRGEEVLTENDPRHRNNTGGMPVRVVIENNGQPIEATDAGANMDINGMVVKIVTRDIQGGGQMSALLERKYNLRRGGF